ncbi:MAG: pantoate--beta-alanine ligase [Bacteroidales bacterium]|nr:pantoate--beta-alanine ligase [Bacteroidales bacterium]
MIIIRNEIGYLKDLINKYKDQKKIIGFVPTMGALHQGHLSLVKRAKNEVDIVIVSIFVNPLQFNDPNDYNSYPRMLEKDISLLEKENLCDILFVPDEKTIYPPEFKLIKFNLGHLEEIMEGKYRPGHFQGVANVVYRLFSLVEPHKAYFGKKDFQQIAIIKKLLELVHFDIEIVECETYREPHGLAMSSRNLLLSETDFYNAKIIYDTLLWIKENIKNYTLSTLKTFAQNKINKQKPFRVEYIEIVDTYSLLPVNYIGELKTVTCCVAVYCGNVRLIDNIEINL